MAYVPRIEDDLSQLPENKIMVVIAPTMEYTRHEANVINNFVFNGGLLLLSLGSTEKHNMQLVLDSFGLDILDMPLGSYPWAIDYRDGSLIIPKEELQNLWHKPKFMECYPVTCKGGFTPYSSVFNVDRRYDLVIKKIYGKGAIVLIGDSRYLLNENLESVATPYDSKKPYLKYWVGNIELLRDILTEFKEQGGDRSEIN